MIGFYGAFRVVWFELRFHFLNFLIVTVLLAGFYFLMGMIASVVNPINGLLFGAYYGFMLLAPLIMYKSTYPVILALGGTRKQFVYAAISVLIIAVLLAMMILNLLYQLYLFFNHLGIISTELLHLGMLLNSQHALAYFWIDILYGLCLIGIGLVATSIWHRFGVLKMLVGATVCILMIITWLAVGDGSSVFSYVMNEHFAFAHILAGVGLLCIFGFYLLMRNSPIERVSHGDQKEFA
ncbi:hypothetical protein [Alkalihalobacillus pseudalcaliphilus]|uniref:hypothetical protein n=1 Tax=Alkalihalobacillus pseudalcaliphilus TaxID=79884 RepID=UPI00064DF815|nr:hypothetical protein [Alkalihalobacillus pseudalcaliphilus]KMK75892.1 hypothetical protein AB990_11565 [Alkalihalobacillus pseudalcaliphilus]